MSGAEFAFALTIGAAGGFLCSGLYGLYLRYRRNRGER